MANNLAIATSIGGPAIDIELGSEASRAEETLQEYLAEETLVETSRPNSLVAETEWIAEECEGRRRGRAQWISVGMEPSSCQSVTDELRCVHPISVTVGRLRRTANTLPKSSPGLLTKTM